MEKQSFKNPDLRIGLLFTLLGALVLLIWIPNDTETGLLEKVRSQTFIGDALAPTVAASMLVLAGLLLIINSLRNVATAELSGNNLKFTLLILSLLSVSIGLMQWSGPAAVWLTNALGGDVSEYRLLRDTAPWKYIGYFIGGTSLIFSLISLMEHRFSLRALLIAMASVVVLIAIYDLPFDNLLLPPNGDF